MTLIPDSEREAFFRDVDEASQKAIWCAVATVANGEPRVRMVHPTWEGDILWFATGANSAKVRQMRANPIVERIGISKAHSTSFAMSGTGERETRGFSREDWGP